MIFGKRAAAALLLLAVLVPLAQAASPHRLSAATEARIAREAQALARQPGVRHVGFYGFVVDRAGRVRDAWVVRGSGNPTLDQAALATIRKAILKHRPAHAPARMRFIVPIEFRKGGVMAQPQ